MYTTQMVAKDSLAKVRPRIMALYSAVLLVPKPDSSEKAAKILPLSSSTSTPIRVGPGLGTADPSVVITIFIFC